MKLIDSKAYASPLFDPPDGTLRRLVTPLRIIELWKTVPHTLLGPSCTTILNPPIFTPSDLKPSAPLVPPSSRPIPVLVAPGPITLRSRRPCPRGWLVT